jgi:hypothetical protein
MLVDTRRTAEFNSAAATSVATLLNCWKFLKLHSTKLRREIVSMASALAFLAFRLEEEELKG